MSKFLNIDCMKGMAEYPDKYFELAICDPPYGIGAGSEKFINGTSKTEKKYYKKNDWDINPPNCYYITELQRISKNQIIWGANYFIELLAAFRCFLIWDKTIHGNSYSDCEMAWTSFDKPARIFIKNIVAVNMDGRIHPTQKPVELYRWLLKNYAKDGDKILDTHVGSASSLIACIEMGFEYFGYELDKDYYDAACKRIKIHTDQLRIA